MICKLFDFADEFVKLFGVFYRVKPEIIAEIIACVKPMVAAFGNSFGRCYIRLRVTVAVERKVAENIVNAVNKHVAESVVIFCEY